ncbi:cytochrome b-c1 complex subunit 6, mitochondrial-like [Tubulanus polymorphus]|uniref:cytochrome b-c1 complex subunit 6, mitochondrial-like n=1 Tax=Tubulanus polymorphus TaxID=672921 RepID=UPI003DA6850B
MALGNEIVAAASSVEPEEEEEEVDLEDPRDKVKERCQATKECQKHLDEYERCNERVNSKSNTSETCAQELYDFIHCVDHCAAQKAFEGTK